MDWLAARQDAIERKLAGRHLAPAANPARMALFDLSSSWLEGSHCPLGARGYSRDEKKGNEQIEYGLRPVFHRFERRVKGHVLICMLAAYLTWHLRQAWAPLTCTGQEPPAPANPVAPARRPAPAQAQASRQHDQDGRPYRSFQGLLAHLGTLTRNELRFAGTPAAVPVLAEPTSEQRQAFELIGAPIPLTLRK
jgi:hypothetical protein